MIESASVTLQARLRHAFAPLLATPLHPQWLVSRIAKRRTSWVSSRAAGDVLDIGCSDQSMRSALPAMNFYVGLDYPTTGRDLYGARPMLFGDAARLPIRDGSFDTVLLLDVLEHLADPEASLREARRVLRPNGTMLLSIPFAYPLHDQPHDYQRLTVFGLLHRLSGAGFSSVVVEEASDGIQAACSCLAIALAQGAIDALATRSWQAIFALPALALVPVVNILGWSLPRFLPAQRLFPAAYFVQAHPAARL